ncbi:MAG TPA: hypothetical protein PK163_08540 [Steroidobacteraceae bacterium]|nr:hypothetical protein [Steroidobacteraceae bacterium]
MLQPRHARLTRTAQRSVTRRRSVVHTWAFALGLVVLAGSAMQTHEAAAAGANLPFARVLVVGVSPNEDRRCQFEQFLASQITGKETQAYASCDVLDQINPLTRESIDKAVAAVQADGVLATVLVSKQQQVEQGDDRDTRGGAQYKEAGLGFAPDYWGVWGVPVVYTDFEQWPPVNLLEGEVHVATRVFDASSATLLDTVDTTVKHIEETDVGMDKVAESIAKDLHRHGYIH